MAIVPQSTNTRYPSYVGTVRAAIFEGRSTCNGPSNVPGKRQRGAVSFLTRHVACGKAQVQGRLENGR